MSIGKKAKSKEKPEDEKEINAYINKGGSQAVSPENGTAIEKPKSVQLRLLPSWIKRIDLVRGKDPLKPLRHPWILRAIHDKLLKEEGKLNS